MKKVSLVTIVALLGVVSVPFLSPAYGLLYLTALLVLSIILFSLSCKGNLALSVFSLMYSLVLVVGAWNLRHVMTESVYQKGVYLTLLGALGLVSGVGLYRTRRTGAPSSPPALRPLSKTERRMLGVLVLFSVLVGFLYYYLSGYIPIVRFLSAILQGQNPSLDALRVGIYVVGSERGSVSYFGQGYLRQVFELVLPWAGLGLLLDDLQRGVPWYRVSSLLSGAAVVFFAVSGGQKWPIVYAAVAFVIGLTLVKFGGNLKSVLGNRRVLLAGSSVVLLLMALTLSQSRASSLGEAFETVLIRVAGSDVGNLFLLTEHLDLTGVRFWGASWVMDLRAFLPGAQETFSVWVHKALHGTANTAPPTILGSFYANFGGLGVFVGMVVTTLYLQSVDSRLRRAKSLSILDVVTQSLVIMNLAMMVHTDIIPRLYSIVFVQILRLGVRIVAGRQTELPIGANGIWRGRRIQV